jgi:hypothetical protein
LRFVSFLRLSFSYSFYFGFEFFLTLIYHFGLVCHFSCLLLVLRLFLLLDDILELFLAFGLLAVLHGSWIRNSNFVPFVVNGLIKGEIEKPIGQFLGLIVMSHRHADV